MDGEWGAGFIWASMNLITQNSRPHCELLQQKQHLLRILMQIFNPKTFYYSEFLIWNIPHYFLAHVFITFGPTFISEPFILPYSDRKVKHLRICQLTEKTKGLL